MAESFSMTATDLLAAASSILAERGYQRIDSALVGDWPTHNSRIFEDDCGIVAVVVYETWEDLSSSWVDAQASLVELISKYMTSYDAKAWEGYLVLLTPSLLGKDARLEATRIRYDTSRVRKLLATADELKTLKDVERLLLPLLPLQVELVAGLGESVLDMLPSLLSTKGLPEAAVRTVVDAFLEQQPLVERLDEYRRKNENYGN